MTKSISSFSLATLIALAPAVARADDEAPPPAPAVAAAAPTSTTLESLQNEVQALREALVRHQEEATLAVEREAAERERSLRLYGFADAGILRNIVQHDAFVASQFTRPLSFYLGRLNLYLDARPDPDFRFLAEIRFSLYPNGSSAGTTASGTVVRTSTTVNDASATNAAAKVSWGSIIVERAALDWTRYPLFSVRVGLFLTPFGIYNVDHGTPTLITTSLPIYIGQGWIPERQLGLQLFGSQAVDRWELGYMATVSNGRTDGILDLGDGKAFGGRLFAKRQGLLRLTVGLSALYQPYRRDREQFGVDPSGMLTYDRTRVVERNMLTVGNDIAVDYRALRVRNEIVFYQEEYTPGKRDMPQDAFGGYAPDNRQFNWSIVVAYRMWKAEPFVRTEYFFCSPAMTVGSSMVAPGAGLNFYFRPNVILKAAWTHPMFYKDNDPEKTAAKHNLHTIAALLTWAF